MAARKKKRIRKNSNPMVMIAIPLLCSLLIVFSGVFFWLMWGEGDSRYAHAVAETLFPQRSLAGVKISDEPKELYNMQISAAVTHSERGSYQNITIDSGAVVLKNVPDNSTAVGIPARVVRRDGEKTELLDHANVPDPIAKEFSAMKEKIEALQREVAELKESRK